MQVSLLKFIATFKMSMLYSFPFPNGRSSDTWKGKGAIMVKALPRSSMRTTTLGFFLLVTFCSVFLCVSESYAQAGAAGPALIPEIKWAPSRLSLTSSQNKQLEKLSAKAEARIAEIDKNQSLSPAQKKAQKEAVVEKLLDEVGGLATAEQKSKLKDIREYLGRYRVIGNQIQPQRLKATIDDVGTFGSRLAGYPGCNKAGDYLEKQLKSIGLEDVRREPFQVTVPVEEGSSLDVAGKKFKIYGLWPNLVRTSQTPPEGLKVRLVYAGFARLADFNGKEIKDTACLLEFNSGTEWLNAPRLGAKAVIFIEPNATMRGEAESKFSAIPISVPRYWISRKDAEVIKAMLKSGQAPEAIIKCQMPWKKLSTFNIFGKITGTDPKLRDQIILIHSYYDSISVVPGLAPGAESTCGVAAMLELARILKQNPPKRTVWFVATSGHFQSLAGMRAYIEQHLEEFRQLGTWEKFRYWLADRGIGSIERRNPPKIYLSVGLDLSSQTQGVGIFYKGYFYDYREDIQNKFSDIARVCRENSELVGAALGFDPARRFADGVNPIAGKNWRNFIPGKIGLDSEVVTLSSARGISFVSIDDARSRVDTPFDTADKVNVSNLAKQVQVLACLIDNIVRDNNELGVMATFKMPISEPGNFTRMALQGGFAKLTGTVVRFDPAKSLIPDDRVADCLVILRSANRSYMGVRANMIEATDDKGRFVIPGVAPLTAYGGNRPSSIGAYKVDPVNGDIIAAPDQGQYGQFYPTTVDITTGIKEVSIVVFDCVATSFFDLIDPQGLRALSTMDVYDGATDGAPLRFGTALAVPEWQNPHIEDMAVVFTEPSTKERPVRIKVIMGAGPAATRFVLINSTKSKPEGIGYDVGNGGTFQNTALHVARDMHSLNSFRINRLAKYRIINQGINHLHELAGRELKKAEAALASKNYAVFDSYCRAAWGFESRAYPDVQKTAKDVVNGVLFYLFLMMPFAYFIERLLIASPHLKWQIAWVFGIFIAVFLVFRYVHPAFDITMNPAIVLLAFIMLALSTLVIGLIVGKFEEQLKELNRSMSGIHKADIRRMSVALAAFSLGISNMRRRKARTILTCITIVMLTFIVLSFTSIVPILRFNIVKAPGKPEYNGVMIRTAMWEPLQEIGYRLLDDEFGHKYPVAPRAWFFGAILGEQSFLTVSKGANTYDAKAAVGVSPREANITRPQRKLLAGRWFQEGDEYTIIIPVAIAAKLGVTPTDVGKAKVSFAGVEYTVIGLMNSIPDVEVKTKDLSRPFQIEKGSEDYVKPGMEVIVRRTVRGVDRFYGIAKVTVVGKTKSTVQMVRVGKNAPESGKITVSFNGIKELKDLDQEPLTPVDFILMQKQTQQGKSMGEAGFREYTHMEPDSVFFIPYKTLFNLGGEVRSIAINYIDADQVKSVLDYLMPRLGLNLYAGKGDKIFRYSTIAAQSGKGFDSVVIPILIAALIVLNTMLGAVYERIKEIGIFSSIGLAPNHIAVLFMAESMVYAVLGSVSGYVLGQGASKILTVTGWLPNLYLNFSSTAAVWSSLVVVLVVLGSTLYPARKASEVATPAVERSWRVPEPEGDTWKITLPFAVTGEQATGVNQFLKEWFQAYEEYSIGDFVTQDVQSGTIESKYGEGCQISCTAWLAPFDLGVSQKVVLDTVPTDMEDVYEVNLTINRLSGDVSNWKRVNRRFLNTLRKQFLIWRTLRHEERERYLTHATETAGTA